MPSDVTSQLQAALSELRRIYPNWRYGQLVSNAAAWAGRDAPANVDEVEDADLLDAIRQHLSRRQPQAKSA